jgi:hypothetical protein
MICLGYQKLVGLGGLEPPTSPLSGVRSNQAELQTRLTADTHFSCYFFRNKDYSNNLNQIDAHHNQTDD